MGEQPERRRADQAVAEQRHPQVVGVDSLGKAVLVAAEAEVEQPVLAVAVGEG